VLRLTELSNTSPTGGQESDMVTTVLQPDWYPAVLHRGRSDERNACSTKGLPCHSRIRPLPIKERADASGTFF
jgi:hypothetical protein